MSAYLADEQAPLSGAALYARLFNVDLQTAALALQSIQPMARPFGMQLVGCIGVQDAKALLGMSVPTTVKIDGYTFGR